MAVTDRPRTRWSRTLWRRGRALAAGPGRVPWPAARWTVNLLALAGAAMLAWSAVIHLHLWADGYKDIPVIGPLFLAQGIASIALAVAVAVSRWLAVLLAGAAALLATAAGLLLSAYGGGLFGYTESLVVTDAMTSLIIEFAGAAALLAAAIVLLAGLRGTAGRGTAGHGAAGHGAAGHGARGRIQ